MFGLGVASAGGQTLFKVDGACCQRSGPLHGLLPIEVGLKFVCHLCHRLCDVFCSYECFFCPLIQRIFFHHQKKKKCKLQFFYFLNIFFKFWGIFFDTHDFYPHPHPHPHPHTHDPRLPPTAHDPRQLVILTPGF